MGSAIQGSIIYIYIYCYYFIIGRDGEIREGWRVGGEDNVFLS